MAKKPTVVDKNALIKRNRQGWRQDVQQWVEFLGTVGVKNIQVVGKSRITFPCCFHNDTNPSAHIYLDSMKFRCFAATCNLTITDPIQFVQKAKGLSYADAVIDFKQVFSHTEFLKSEEVSILSEAYVVEQRLKLIADVLHENLLDNWENPNIPESTKEAIQWLRVNRELEDPAGITTLGLFPRLSDFKRLFKGTVADLEWAITYLGSFLDNRYVDYVTFAYSSSPTLFSSFKLRKPGPGHTEVIIKKADAPLGFYGLANPGYKTLVHNEQFNNIIIVEGEFDQIAFYKNQLAQSTFNEPVIALSGNGHSGISELAEYGFTRASIIGDDDAGGIKFAMGVLEKSSNVSSRIFVWTDKLRHNYTDPLDPDLAIKLYKFEKVYPQLVDERNYKFPPRWCRDLVQNDLKNVNSEDVRSQEEIVVRYGNLIKDETELRTFCELITEDYPLLTSSGVFKTIRKTNDSDIGFIHNIAAWIRRKMLVVYMDTNENVLCLWNKAKRVHVYVNLRNKQNAYSSFFQQVHGITVLEWARDEVGLPSYYPPIDVTEDNERPGTKFVRGQVETCLYEAFGLLAGEAVARPPTFWSQGIHLEGIAEGDGPGYVVNGDKVFKLKWNADGTQLSEVTLLEGPVDGGTVFDLARRDQITFEKDGTWLPIIKEGKDFFAKPKYNLASCYEIIYDIINTACEFKNQENDTAYCTLLVMYSYLLDSMQRRVMTHLFGEFESGKSSLLSLLAGSLQLHEFRLTYHAATSDNYTLAGVFQSFTGTKLIMGLDEANDTGDDYNNKIRKILESFRGLATKGVADRTLGSTGQHAKSQFLYNAVVTASATEIHDDMDYSRFRTINLVKNPNKANTRVLLTQKYGTQLFADVRDSVFLNMIHAAPAIARHYKQLPVEFSAGTTHRLDRAVDGLLPLAAILKYMNKDYLSFIITFCTNRDDEANLRKITRDGQSILDRILNIPKVSILIPGAERPVDMSIRAALRTPATREAINRSECGVYYDEKEQAIGIAWEQARVALLQNDHSLRLASKSLKSTAVTTQHWLSDSKAVKTGLKPRLFAKGLAGATVYSFFSLATYVKEIEEAMDDETPGNELPTPSKTPSSVKVGTGGMNL